MHKSNRTYVNMKACTFGNRDCTFNVFPSRKETLASNLLSFLKTCGGCWSTINVLHWKQIKKQNIKQIKKTNTFTNVLKQINGKTSHILTGRKTRLKKLVDIVVIGSTENNRAQYEGGNCQKLHSCVCHCTGELCSKYIN